MKRLITGLLVFFSSITISTMAMAEDIKIVGTGDGVVVLKSIGEAFTKASGVKVDVPDSIGSGGGIKAVGADEAKIARVARKLKDKEAPLGLTYTPFATIPTVFCVNSSVSVDTLTAKQATDIYTGAITNWKEVGGNDEPIRVVRREEDDSTLANLKASFPGFKDIVITDKSKTANSVPEMVEIVAGKAGTIAFAALDVALANNFKVLRIDGKAPTDPGYPTVGTMAFVYKEANNTGSIKQLIEFATSSAAHDAITSKGGIPIK